MSSPTEEVKPSQITQLTEENAKLKEALSVKTIALDIVREENEVNKKNGYKYRSQIETLKEENEKLKRYPKLVHNISQNLHSTRCEDCLTMEWIDEEIRKGQDRPPPEHKSTHPEYHDLMPFFYTIKELKVYISELEGNIGSLNARLSLYQK
jgi:hypothetical protein